MKKKIKWRTPSAGDGSHGGPNARDSSGSPHLSAQVNFERESSAERLTGNQNHHVPTPTSSDGIERKSTNVGASNGELCFETNKSVSLDRWVKKNPKARKQEDVTNMPAADSRQPNFPTPRIRSLCGGSGSAEMIDKLATDGTISSEERTAMRGGGKLNPEWVEWLMGWPIGWTALDAQATEWFRSSRPRPGAKSSNSRRGNDSSKSKGI